MGDTDLIRKNERRNSMETRKKKALAFCYSLILIIILVSFMVQPVLAQKKNVVGYLLPNVGPWYTDKWYGVKDEAAKAGLEVTLYSAGGYANISKQVSQMEDLIQKKVNGIILHPTSGSALIPTVQKALKAGIRVSTEHAPLTSSIVPHIWEAPPEAGRLMGALLVSAIHGKGKIAALPGPPGQAEAMALWQGFAEYVKNFPEVKIVAEERGDVNVAAALKSSEDILTAHPDVAGIYTWFEMMGQGAVQALKARGFKPGQVKVITAWVGPETLGIMKEGWIQYALPGRAVEVGRASVRNMAKMLKGEKVPMTIDVPMIAIGPEEVDRFDRSGWAAPKQ
jgi:ribose transport system substrate-binding protein